jgi:hypothetical protein
MRTPTRALVMSAVAVAATLSAMPSAHAAAEDTEVSIVGIEDFVVAEGTFQADGGGLCASGTTAQPDGVEVTARRRTLTYKLDKVFTCNDGSGTFTLHVRALYLPCAPADRGVWSVVAGTGDYEGLRGSGVLVGTYFPGPCDDAEGIQDVYAGHVFSG